VLKVNPVTSQYIIATALLFAMPLFVVMGSLSDRIGRKWIMMARCLLAALSYIPIYQAMQRVAAQGVLTYTGFGAFISNPVAWKLILLVFIQVVFVTMVYGPIAAYLVEAFPAKIRYTALSLPYHIGNGVFGGLLPVIGVAVVNQTGNIYAGLYYPIFIASVTFIVGSLLLRETKHTLIWDEVK
jgi:MFS family permease